MCNLYSITKGQQAIRDLAQAMRDNAGNMPPLPGVFPDYSAPIVRTAPVRELTLARRGIAFARLRPKVQGKFSVYICAAFLYVSWIVFHYNLRNEGAALSRQPQGRVIREMPPSPTDKELVLKCLRSWEDQNPG
jgi:hypothetical protein